MYILRTLAVLALTLVTAGLASAAELPGDSLYRLDLTLTDHHGRHFTLAARRGRPQLVSMFYTSCQYVCPLIIDTLKKTQAALTPAERARLDVLLVSFDPARDTPARLAAVFGERKLDAGTWTLARTGPGEVRTLAAALDIQYRALESGDINHSSALVLLDRDGRLRARTDRIGEVDADFVAAVKQALAAP
jgi:protein SCO1/2